MCPVVGAKGYISIKKAGARLHFLYRHANYLNERSRKTLCSALIQGHFDYCCSSWFSTLSVKLKKRLQVTQNKLVRFILNMDSRSHIGQTELNKFGMLSVNDRVTQLKLNHVYQIFHEMAPDYICQKFRKVSDRLCIIILPGVVPPILLFQE